MKSQINYKKETFIKIFNKLYFTVPKKNKKIQGIGGWLILPTIGFFLSAGTSIFLFSVTGLSLLSGKAYASDLVIFLFSGINAFLSIYPLVLEFKKKKEFPKWAIVKLWVETVTVALFSLLFGGHSIIFHSTLAAIIWTSYFTTSVRVKNTFVR